MAKHSGVRSRLIQWTEDEDGTGEVPKYAFIKLHTTATQNLTASYIKAKLGVFLWSELLPDDLKTIILGPACRRIMRNDARLLELVKAGDFVDFMLNAWVEPSVSTRSTLQEQAQQLDIAFKRTFIGDSVQWMSNALDRYERMYKPYVHNGKMIVYLQSSGTGKSRTLKELSKQCLMLTICFRDIHKREVDPGKGWPPGDKPICQFFSDPPRHDGVWYEGEELAAAFMGALLAVIVEKLQDHQSDPDKDTVDAFHAYWTIHDPSDVEHSPRFKLLEEVREKATKMLESERDKLLNLRSILEGDSEVLWLEAISELFIHHHATNLEKVCKQRSPSRFILAFDECSELNKCGGKHAPRTTAAGVPGISLIALKRIIKTMDTFDIWHILADTSSSIQDVQPITGEFASSRRLRSEFIPLPVYPFIPWDIMVKSSALPETPLEALRVKYLANYGRPYWSTLPTHDVLVAAKEKLLCATTFNPRDLRQVFAVFSARLLLELSTDKASTHIAVDAVQSHMRILTGMTSSGIVTTYAPSEPMLAIAAIHCLLESDDTYRKATKLLVNDLILKGHVLERGLQGDLIARILLMLARDSAISPEGKPTTLGVEPDLDDSGSIFVPRVRTVSLAAFLKALFGDKLATGDTEEQTQEDFVKKILKWAGNYRLNFTHFVRLENHIEELSPDFLTLCWRRGVALVCVLEQAVFDLLLVVYRGDLSKPFDSSNFSLVSIRIKLRPASASSDLIKHLTCPVIVEEQDVQVGGKRKKELRRWKPDHLVILMDLGSNVRFRGTGTFGELGRGKAERPPHRDLKSPRQKKTPTRAWQGYLDDDEPERYYINVRGLDVAEYPAMRRFAPSLKDLLERERQVNRSVDFSDLTEAMDAALHPVRNVTTIGVD